MKTLISCGCPGSPSRISEPLIILEISFASIVAPGKVLSGLIKRIDSQLRVYSIDTPEGLSEVICLK